MGIVEAPPLIYLDTSIRCPVHKHTADICWEPFRGQLGLHALHVEKTTQKSSLWNSSGCGGGVGGGVVMVGMDEMQTESKDKSSFCQFGPNTLRMIVLQVRAGFK